MWALIWTPCSEVTIGHHPQPPQRKSWKTGLSLAITSMQLKHKSNLGLETSSLQNSTLRDIFGWIYEEDFQSPYTDIMIFLSSEHCLDFQFAIMDFCQIEKRTPLIIVQVFFSVASTLSCLGANFYLWQHFDLVSQFCLVMYWMMETLLWAQWSED